ncbi:MAG: linear amide C-N hydrolase [Candidatus Nanopelagicales bacterium]
MCTNFKAPIAEDGTVVVGRSLDYPALMGFQICVIPRGQERSALVDPDKPAGKAWTTQHGVVGVSLANVDAFILDGMNDAGLSAHVLYMVGGFFHPAKFRGDGSDVSQAELVTYLLTTCASVAEVREMLPQINVWGFRAGLPFTPPVHLAVHDREESVVVEFRPEGVVIVDNPTAVATNSPFLDWHLTNLHNYVGISAHNPERQRVRERVGGLDIRALGVGWGLRGLPGDFTGPSRFVRAVMFNSLATTPKDGREAEMLTLHILNTFDVPAGVVEEPGPGGMEIEEVTYADTICNLTDLRYSYRALDDPTVYVVDLKGTDFSGGASRFRDISARGEFTPISV